MKQVIPFYKEIVFENPIANLTSISLEHNEKVLDGEVSGEFLVYGDYKIHNDTTEKENFKFKLPFTALIPDDVDPLSVKVDITDFKYEQIDNDVLRVDIDFSIEGDALEIIEERDEKLLEDFDKELELLDDDLDKEIDELLNINDCEEVEETDKVLEEELDMEDNVSNDVREEELVTLEKVVPTVNLKEETKFEETVEVKEEVVEEYVTYHVHVVSREDSVESIMKLYNVSLDILKEYNEITNLKLGDKVIIPYTQDE